MKLMTRIPRRIVVLVGLVSCAAILLLIVWVVLGRDKNSKEPKFIGYYGTQPELQVTLLPSSESSADISKILDTANKFFNKSVTQKQDFWPEPSSITERKSSWWVKYKKKERVVILNGQEVIQSELPGGICIQVNKPDLSCEFVPVR